jgi:hypothetical protein
LSWKLKNERLVAMMDARATANKHKQDDQAVRDREYWESLPEEELERKIQENAMALDWNQSNIPYTDVNAPPAALSMNASGYPVPSYQSAPADGGFGFQTIPDALGSMVASGKHKFSGTKPGMQGMPSWQNRPPVEKMPWDR